MELLKKELGKGEINWKGIVIPRAKKSLFPPAGVTFSLSDGIDSYKVKVDNQCRIRLTQWFKQHATIKEGDEVVFYEKNGMVYITLSNNGKNRALSTRELLGKETPTGKIIDIEYSSEGPVVIVQRVERMPLDQLLIAGSMK